MNLNSPFFAWLTLFATGSAVVGILWKWIVGPHVHRFIEDNIVKPLAKIEHYTTVNGNKDAAKPTLRDDLGAIKDHLAKQDADIAEIKAAFADHLTVADGDRVMLSRNTADIKRLKDKP